MTKQKSLAGKVLIQTRVNARTAKWVEREAARLEVTVAGWLRAKVLQLHEEALKDAANQRALAKHPNEW